MATFSYNPGAAYPRMTTYTPWTAHAIQRAVNAPGFGGPRPQGVGFASLQGSYLNNAMRAASGVGGQHVGGVNEVLNRRGPLQAIHGRQQQTKGLAKGRAMQQQLSGPAGSGRAPVGTPTSVPSSTLANSPQHTFNRTLSENGGLVPWATGDPSGNPVVEAMNQKIDSVIGGRSSLLGDAASMRPGGASENLTRPRVSLTRTGR